MKGQLKQVNTRFAASVSTPKQKQSIQINIRKNKWGA